MTFSVKKIIGISFLYKGRYISVFKKNCVIGGSNNWVINQYEKFFHYML